MLSLTALTGGVLSYMVALAWNDAARATVRGALPTGDKHGEAQVLLIYALVMTLMVIIIVWVLEKAQQYSASCDQQKKSATRMYGIGGGMSGGGMSGAPVPQSAIAQARNSTATDQGIHPFGAVVTVRDMRAPA